MDTRKKRSGPRQSRGRPPRGEPPPADEGGQRHRLADLEREVRDLRTEVSRLRLTHLVLEEGDHIQRALVEQSLVGVAIAQDGKILYANPAYCEMFGYLMDEIVEQSVLLVVASEDRALIAERAAARIAGREVPVRYTFRGIKKDSTRLLVEVYSPHAFQFRDRPTIIATFQDVSALSRAEDTARASERFLDEVFACIQDGISVLDLERRVIRVNPTMERWYAHAMPLVGKKCHEAYHLASSPCAVCPCTRTMESGEKEHAEVPLIGEGGAATGWLDLYSFPLFDLRTGRLKGVIEYVRDCSDRHRAEVELENRNQELFRTNQELRQLQRARELATAMVSHELRSPLVTGLGYIELLLAGALGPVPQKMADRMRTAQKNLTRLRSLIEAMLGYRRLVESDVPNVGPTDLPALLQEAHAELLVRTSLPAVQVQIEVSPEVHNVLADRGMIRRALDNLLDNAATHAPGARIRLVAEPIGETQVRLSVIDQGPGFPPEVRDRAFQPFIRSMDSTSGCGLGLAIVQAIVQAHHSEVELETRAGYTCLSFRLQALISGENPRSIG